MTSIKTQRLFLRPLEHEDTKILSFLGNNKKIWQNLTDSFPHPYTLEKAKEWITYNKNKKRTENFAITINNELIGMMGFKENTETTIGYWIGEPYWGKGYATEALKVLIDYLFRTTETEKIKAKVFTHNPPSAKVLEKCGFEKENHTETTIKDGKPIEEHVYVKNRFN